MFPKKKEKSKEEHNPATEQEQPKTEPTAQDAETLQKQLEELRRQAEALQKEKDDIFAKLQRLAADYDNYQKRAAKQITDNVAYEKDKIVKWHCRNCGYVHEGKEAPKICPACKHPQAFYEVLEENY